MTTFRCPKHDVLFEANKAPTQDGHKKCHKCTPPPKSDKPEPLAPHAVSTVDESGLENE